MSSNISIDADFVINEQPDIQADLHINFIPDVSDFVTREELAEDLTEKQDVLTAGANIQIEDNVISATDTTYTAGEGISIENNVISNTLTSAEWGNIQGDIQEQTDLIDLIDTKIDIEATARENNDLSLQNGINTLNDDLTAEISNRGTADGILQDNIDTLSETVTSNYNTLDGKISDNKTAIDNHIADKSNPHDVTKSQVGLGNVDNTSDLNKPISTATQTALDGKVPTSRTVNNKALTSDITLTASDVDALPDTTTINDLTTAEQQSALNSGANSTNIGQIATNTQAISTEVTNRQNADNALQSQIDALVVASDVFDIVGTYAELQAYDISTVPVNDIIKVLVDSTHDNAATYYRCVENDNVKSWSYIGAEGAYYTKSEADGRFVEQTTTINGQALSNNITLDAEDVGALPDSTTIGNGTLTIQKNGSTIDTFGANDTGNTTVNITVPTDTGDLTNNAGYTKNVGTVTSVNNTQPDANGNVTLSIPTQVQSNWDETDITSKAYIQNKPTIPSPVTVDSALSTTSENPVQNKVINSALGDKYDASNPNGYTSNVGTVTSVNNVSPVNGNVTLSIPTVDQTYNASSSNAQSGVALAGAGFLQVKGTITSSTDLTTLEEGIYTIDGVTHSGFPDASQAFYGVLVQYGGDYKPQLLVAGMPSVGGLYHRRYLTGSNSWTGWVRCGNAATGSNALTIGGTPATVTAGTNIGINSTAEGTGSTSIGNTAKARATYSTAVGRSSTATANSSIQIGYGTNSTANSLSVGFYNNATTHYRWDLLDGTTGKIPSDRINIATSVSSSSTNTETVGAKLFYDTVGNIETALNTINSGVSA